MQYHNSVDTLITVEKSTGFEHTQQVSSKPGIYCFIDNFKITEKYTITSSKIQWNQGNIFLQH